MKYFFINIIKAAGLSFGDVVKNVIRSLISSFGIFFLITFVILYMSFRSSIKTYLDKNVFGALSIDEIRITAKIPKKFDAFAQSQSVLGIPGRVVRAVKAMPEVKKTYTLVQMEHKTSVRGELMDKERKVYIPLGAIENDFFKEREGPSWKSISSRDPLPIVAPRFGIDMLNNYLAAKGFPILPIEGLRGYPLELVIQTTQEGEEPKKEYIFNGKIHAVTDKLPFTGIVVPLDFMNKFLRQHGKDSAEKNYGLKYIMMYVKVKDIHILPETAAKLKKFGVEVEAQSDVALKANRALKVIDDSSTVIIGMFLILTVISIFNSYLAIVYMRSQKFSLRRVLGVSKYQIVMGFVVEAAFIGALYGLAGYYAGNAILDKATEYITSLVPSLKGMIMRAEDTKLLYKAMLFSALISSISALIPASFAANMNLFRAMRK